MSILNKLKTIKKNIHVRLKKISRRRVHSSSFSFKRLLKNVKNFFKNQKKQQLYHSDYLDFGAVFLRTLKLLSNFTYILILLFALLGLGVGLGYFASQVDSVKIPKKSTLVTKVNALTRISKMTYSDNSLISNIDADLLRTPVESKDISQNMKKAIIATEDENFKTHKGIVPKAVFRATFASVLGFGEGSGGSTLTQQLLKQQVLGDDPTFKRKTKEMIYALALERYIDKDTILTDYLNVSPFGRNNRGQNIAGIEEAAQGIFGVSSKDLTIPQAAFLAGLPQSPINYSPYTAAGQFKNQKEMRLGLKRAQNVLYNMYRTGVLSKSDYNNYKAYDLTKDFKQPQIAKVNEHDYLYYSVFREARQAMYDYLIKRDKVSSKDLKNDKTKEAYKDKATQELRLGGYNITTTINKKVYNAMQTAVAQHGNALDDKSGKVEVGNVLMDNSSGAVLGFIGGRNYKENQNNHAFDTARSPGSSIKPMLAYGPAIDQGLIGSASMLSNYPTTFSGGQKIMHGRDEGTAMVDLQEALDVSWNIPAYWTYQNLLKKGVNVSDYMEKMNYAIADYNIESLPLGGGIETSVAQQTNGYQTIANGGVYQKQYMVEKITDSSGKIIYQHKSDPVRIYSKATASILNELLRGPISSGRTTTFKDKLKKLNAGLAGADWTGKTGTTDDYSDVWLLLSTPKVTLGGWAGHDDNRSLESSAGYHNNAQYMAYLVNTINQADPQVLGTNQRFNLDANVIKTNVLKSTGLKPAAVNVNGKKITLSGQQTTSYWAKNGPGNTTYKFAVGGSDSDYQKAWNAILGR